jgi:nucleoside phosphorylase
MIMGNRQAIEDRAETDARPDIVIITVREDETRAMLSRVSGREPAHYRNRTYSVGKVTNKNGRDLLVAFVKTTEQGPNAANGTARDAIEDLDPGWIILVGIAGALPEREYTLGDVIVASRLHDFTVGAYLQDQAPEFINQGSRVAQNLQDLISFPPDARFRTCRMASGRSHRRS